MRARPVGLALVLVLGFASLVAAQGAGAGDPSELRSEAGALRAQNASIESKSRSALLELYSIESKLAGTSRRLDALHRAQADIERKAASARGRLAIARHAAKTAEAQLEKRLRELYVNGDEDPLAVLLGASSLDEAITTLDHLSRLADQDKQILAQTRTARAQLRSALAVLAKRRAQLAELTAATEQTRSSLLHAKAERTSYLASLSAQKKLNTSQIASLTKQAHAIEQKSTKLVSSGGSSGSPPPVGTAPSGTRMTVVATGYALSGTTATGAPVGWGVVAVDPSVIPLGTRMSVPGYGEGIAADTGSAVKGATIDLWFPTTAQALAWGRRTVTITLH